MKNLTKFVVGATAIIMSLCCVSAYAAETPAKADRNNQKQSVFVNMEMKMGAERNNGIADKTNVQNGNTKPAFSKEMPVDEKAVEIAEDDMLKKGKEKFEAKPKRNNMEEKNMSTEIAEEKTAKIEELKADLAAKLEAGEITQEEYDKAVAKIKGEDFMFGGNGGRDMKDEKPEEVEMTEEEKAAKIEELKADLAAKLEASEITQEEYDEAISKIAVEDFEHGRKIGKNRRNGNRNVPVINDESENAKDEIETV